MGIPKFYGTWLKSKGYPNVLLRSVPRAVTGLYIDANGIIHTSAAKIYGYSSDTTPEYLKLVTESAKKNPQALEYDLFTLIIHTIVNLVNQVTGGTSLETLVIAIDGVAPLAKIQQQRQRRYRSAETPRSFLFDTNSITPGTEFMMRLSTYIKRWFSLNPTAINAEKIIYSSHMTPGEGEHKIIDFMRFGTVQQSTGAHIFYGLDADLIMLALVAPFNNIYLMREDIRDIVSIDNLKIALQTDLESETALSDFIVMMTLLGNDFLPACPSLHDMVYSLDLMFRVYRSINLPLTTIPSSSNPIGAINWPHLASFIATLSQFENTLLEYESNKSFKYPSRMLTVSTTIIQSFTGPTRRQFDPELFRSAWYTNELGPKTDPTLLMQLNRIRIHFQFLLRE